jgi:antirestriction protein
MNGNPSARTRVRAPQIYVACLSAYTAGRLHGQWIDTDTDAEQMRTEILAMLARSPEPDAEEWAIHDTDGFDGVDIGECESLDKVAAIAELLREHPGAVVSAFLGEWGDRGADEMVTTFTDVYGGHWTSLHAFADEILLPDHVKDAVGEDLYGYLDLDAYVRDQEIDGAFSTVPVPDGVHVIWTGC